LVEALDHAGQAHLLEPVTGGGVDHASSPSVMPVASALSALSA
jgi:hypothetical protein